MTFGKVLLIHVCTWHHRQILVSYWFSIFIEGFKRGKSHKHTPFCSNWWNQHL